MMIYQEKIAPPLAPLSEEEQMKLITDSIASEDRWVEDFIARLAGVIRDVKHWAPFGGRLGWRPLSFSEASPPYGSQFVRCLNSLLKNVFALPVEPPARRCYPAGHENLRCHLSRVRRRLSPDRIGDEAGKERRVSLPGLRPGA